VPTRFDEYLARLQTRLERKLPKDKAAQKTAEIRSHLLLALETNPDENQALLEMGSDRLLADDLIRAETGITKRSAWRWTALPAALIVLTYLFIYNTPQAGLGLAWMAGVVFVVLLGLFLSACLRSRKWLVLPLVAVIFPTTLAASLLLAYHRGEFDREVLANRYRSMKAEVARYDDQVATARKFAAGLRSSDPAYRNAPQERPRMVLNPYIPFSKPHPQGTVLHPKRVYTVAEASRLWKLNGAAYVAQLEADRTQYADSVERMRNLPNTASSTALLGAAIMTALWAILLAIVNGTALVAYHLARRAHEHAWPRRLA
jgi:uncharacterized membrane protein